MVLSGTDVSGLGMILEMDLAMILSGQGLIKVPVMTSVACFNYFGVSQLNLQVNGAC